jgi:DNA-binding NarL/FixJ family response regulator
MSIGVVIADDHPVARQGLQEYIQREPDMEVIAVVDSGAELLDVLGAAPSLPHVAVVDARMPTLDGIETTTRIKQHFSAVNVIVLSAFEDQGLVAKAMFAGAHAYLLKSKDGPQITSAIRLVADGEVVIDRDVEWPIVNGASARTTDRAPRNALSAPDIELLERLSRGQTNKEIAAGLSLSTEAVKGRLARLFRRMGTVDRAATVAEAIRRHAID